jgi:hypothetical protein
VATLGVIFILVSVFSLVKNGIQTKRNNDFQSHTKNP